MIYNIFLDNIKIGTSLLEYGDPPMGVVFGKIVVDDKTLCFDFISKYCKDNAIEVTEYPEDKLINTRTIPTLKIVNENGTEIKGMSSNLQGMDSDGYEINIEGIEHPLFEKEFPHHIKAYNDLFK